MAAAAMAEAVVEAFMVVEADFLVAAVFTADRLPAAASTEVLPVLVATVAWAQEAWAREEWALLLRADRSAHPAPVARGRQNPAAAFATPLRDGIRSVPATAQVIATPRAARDLPVKDLLVKDPLVIDPPLLRAQELKA